MTAPIRSSFEPATDADEALPAELLRIIEGLAELQARADYAARFEAEPGSQG